MSAGRICNREVHVANREISAELAARRMAEENVGTLLIVEDGRPIGILTDRDVVVRAIARGRDPKETAISEIMSAPVISIGEQTPIEDALTKMAAHRIRRLAVVGDEGELVGLLALDDVLDLLSEESAVVGRIVLSRARPPNDAYAHS
jgi:CBS domain-containing protein